MYVSFINITGLCQSNNGGMHSSSDIPTPAPKFITKGHLYKAVIGDTIILPCKVKDLGETESIVDYFFYVQKLLLSLCALANLHLLNRSMLIRYYL